MRRPFDLAIDPRWPVAVGLLCALALTACGASDEGTPAGGDGADTWVAPADATDGLDAIGTADELADTVVGKDDDDVWYEQDLQWVTDIPEHVDICSWFDACEGEDATDEAPPEDAAGEADDAGPTEADADPGGGGGDGAADVMATGDVDEGADQAADASAELTDADDATETPDDDAFGDEDVLDEDVLDDPDPDTTDDPDTIGDPDTGGEPDTVFSECDELGIDDSWAGSFVGVIEYDVETGGLLTPEEGLLSIGGDLTFDISCIDSKLVVNGSLEGFATVQGQGDFPFSIALGGYYDPTTQHLSASMGDGVVSLYGLIEVYFVGEFNGDVTESGGFDGDWTASATGTNQAFVTGDAEGEGTWNAEPAL